MSLKARNWKPLSATLVVTENRGPCAFCHRSDDDEIIYGKLYAIGDVQCHYFCALLSCCLIQKAKDDEGLFGFLYHDIVAEVDRSRKHRCSYCGKRGASLGCSTSTCKKQFHLPCGRQHKAVSLFYGNYKSFCVEHAPKQEIPPHIMEAARLREKADKYRALKASTDLFGANGTQGDIVESEETICLICYEAVGGYPTVDTFWPPCCGRDAWFHRTCLTRMASSAGVHYLKCPLCNDKDTFCEAVVDQGYYIPDRDAAWELEQNAFAEIYERPLQCVADTCQCPNGREHDMDTGPWDIKLCIMCGTIGMHMQCITEPNKTLLCDTCRPLAPDDIDTFTNAIEQEILREQSRKAAEMSTSRPIMPCRMSIRWTKPRHLALPSTSSAMKKTEAVGISAETQSTASSRMELNLKTPRRCVGPDSYHLSRGNVLQSIENENIMLTPFKMLQQGLNEKFENMDVKEINKFDLENMSVKLRDKLLKPRPRSVKMKIVKAILEGVLGNVFIDSKIKTPVKMWSSPDKTLAALKLSYESPKKTIASPKKYHESPIPSHKSPARGIVSPNKTVVSPKTSYESRKKNITAPNKTGVALKINFESHKKTLTAPNKSLESPKTSYKSPAKDIASPNKTLVLPKTSGESPEENVASNKTLASLIITFEPPKKTFASPNKSPESPKKTLESPKMSHDSRAKDIASPYKIHVSPEISYDSPKKFIASPEISHESLKTYHESPNKTLASPQTSYESPQQAHVSPEKTQTDENYSKNNYLNNTPTINTNITKNKIDFDNLLIMHTEIIHDTVNQVHFEDVNVDSFKETHLDCDGRSALKEAQSNCGEFSESPLEGFAPDYNSENIADRELSESPLAGLAPERELSESPLAGFAPEDTNKNNLTVLESLVTPKKIKNVDIQKDSSLEISEENSAINIDVMKNKNDSDFVNVVNSPVKTNKCALKFSPKDKKLTLQHTKIDIDMDIFKNHYLNEVGKHEKTNVQNQTEEKINDSDDTREKTVIDFDIDASYRKKLKRKLRTKDVIDKKRLKKNRKEDIRAQFDKSKESDVEILCSKDEPLDLTVKSLDDKSERRRRRKEKKKKYRHSRDKIHLKIRLKITKSSEKIPKKIKHDKIKIKKEKPDKIKKEKPDKIKKEKPDKIKKELKQYILKYPNDSSQTQKTICIPDNIQPNPKKRKIKLEKHCDNLVQTSIQSFFKLKSKEECIETDTEPKD